MNILGKIVEQKKKEVALLKADTSIRVLEGSRFFGRECISLSDSLLTTGRTGIIAEFKRRSPSLGIINPSSGVEEVTSGYFAEGASGVSVLTDFQHFGGSGADIISIRRNSLFPILRKDFIINEYQVVESKSIGADVILLIAAILSKKQILFLSRLARSLGLEVLLEIHEYEELGYLNCYTNIVGVNNRNLKTFEVNTNKSEELAAKIPEGFLKISESGISSAQTVKRLKSFGYNGFLIGGKFMSAPDPVIAFSDFVKEII
jgi:indole-3-glycerol phosphate synthase